MSMPIIKPCTITCEDAACDIMLSIAMQESALSHILNAEGEKIQKAVASDNISVDDLLCINDSVSKTIREITGLELVLLSKLEEVCSYNCRPRPPIHNDGRLCFYVYDCKTDDGLVGAEVIILKNNEIVDKGYTDCHGKYTSELLPFGCYFVIIEYNEQVKKLCNIKIEKHCCNDFNICLDIPMPAPIMPKKIDICGQITDKCGRPLANACIFARGAELYNVYTNQCGFYELRHFPVFKQFNITPVFCGCRGPSKQFNCINKNCYKIDFEI